jgi:hypothetical protein
MKLAVNGRRAGRLNSDNRDGAVTTQTETII